MNTPASVSNGEQDRVVATDLLQHTLWLLEQHESRNEAAQKAAVTLLTTTGAVAALVPKTLPGTATGLAGALLVIVGLAAVATFVACVKVLQPRRRQQGLPSVAALQRFVAALDAGQPVPMPQMQVLVDLLNSKHVGQPSPISNAAADAEDRMRCLTRAYYGLAVTFAAAIALTSAIAFTHP